MNKLNINEKGIVQVPYGECSVICVRPTDKDQLFDQMAVITVTEDTENNKQVIVMYEAVVENGVDPIDYPCDFYFRMTDLQFREVKQFLVNEEIMTKYSVEHENWFSV